MSLYQVFVTETRETSFLVEAEDKDAAREVAEELAHEELNGHVSDVEVDVMPIRGIQQQGARFWAGGAEGGWPRGGGRTMPVMYKTATRYRVKVPVAVCDEAGCGWRESAWTKSLAEKLLAEHFRDAHRELTTSDD